MEIRQVNAGNGWNWIADGFGLFKQSPVIWIALFFVYLLLAMLLSFIPVVGPIILNLLAPVFMAGFMLGCKAIEDGEELEINHLFAGFSRNTSKLITVGGI
ncbi:MAG TPA: BPSS1780 family membrane protein, partial [Methylophilaceae bacterium]|nr:BPSS1780 family membrane protein [Methylophilaceae bacterium]